MTNITVYDLGVIELKDSVYVSDPCYSVGTWCQALVEGLKPGKYHGFMRKADTDWGRRVIDLWVAHEDNVDVYPVDILDETIDIGVDSGAAGIYDKEYYEKYHQKEDMTEDPEADAWYDNQFDLRYYYDIDGKEIIEKLHQAGYFYTDQERRDGIALDSKCVISFSGYGDGGYDLYASKNSAGEIVGLRINFINDDFEEEEENAE